MSKPPRHPRIPKQKRDADGRRLCRWCEAPVEPPRRTFCSQACVDEALIRAQPQAARNAVKQRDNGRCAACGLDTHAIRHRYEDLVRLARWGIEAPRIKQRILDRYGFTLHSADHNPRNLHETWIPVHGPRHPDAERVLQIDNRLRRTATRVAAAYRARWKARGLDPTSHMWEADHIHPVEAGGGGCGLDNLQTLCLACHRRKTADQAAARAAARRAETTPAAPPKPSAKARARFSS